MRALQGRFWLSGAAILSRDSGCFYLTASCQHVLEVAGKEDSGDLTCAFKGLGLQDAHVTPAHMPLAGTGHVACATARGCWEIQLCHVLRWRRWIGECLTWSLPQ